MRTQLTTLAGELGLEAGFLEDEEDCWVQIQSDIAELPIHYELDMVNRQLRLFKDHVFTMENRLQKKI